MKASTRKSIRQILEVSFPQAVQRCWTFLRLLLNLIGRQLKNWSVGRVPLGTRFGLWRRGFLSEAYVLYGITDLSQTRDYLPDYHRFIRTREINGDFAGILDDKCVFYLVMRNYTDRVVPMLGLIKHGRFLPFSPDPNPHLEPCVDVLASFSTSLVVKPYRGSGGEGLLFYEHNEGTHVVNGQPVDDRALAKKLEQGTYVVSPRVFPARYSREIYPKTANTLRMLTMWDYDRNEPFVAAAIQKFGTDACGLIESWAGGGALAVGLDVETGTLGRAYSYPRDGKMTWYAHHPGTGAAIEGVRVPNWDGIKTEMLQLASRLCFLPYIGWDVCPTDDGFVIFEGNNRSELHILQVNTPLLADERVRKFFQHHHVI